MEKTNFISLSDIEKHFSTVANDEAIKLILKRNSNFPNPLDKSCHSEIEAKHPVTEADISKTCVMLVMTFKLIQEGIITFNPLGRDSEVQFCFEPTTGLPFIVSDGDMTFYNHGIDRMDLLAGTVNAEDQKLKDVSIRVNLSLLAKTFRAFNFMRKQQTCTIPPEYISLVKKIETFVEEDHLPVLTLMSKTESEKQVLWFFPDGYYSMQSMKRAFIHEWVNALE